MSEKLSISIRSATAADCDTIRELFYQTINTVNTKDYTPEQIKMWASGADNREKWIEKIKEQFFYVALHDGVVVGFASVTDQGYLDFMFVHKDHQGQGIGSALIDTLETKTKELALSEIYAEVSITARPFFSAKGYATSKQYVKMVNGVAFDDAVMVKFF